jgi:hypothetical protein
MAEARTGSAALGAFGLLGLVGHSEAARRASSNIRRSSKDPITSFVLDGDARATVHCADDNFVALRARRRGVILQTQCTVRRSS